MTKLLGEQPYRITVPLYRWIKDGNGGGRSELAGARSRDIELQLDRQGLSAMLGSRALRTKSRKSILAGGLIVARAVNIQEDSK